MPNWVFNGLTVSGDSATIDEMIAQLNKPITTYHDKFVKDVGMVKSEQTYSNPVFSFMNVVAPTDLDAYYGDEKKIDSDNLMESVMIGFATGNDWYNWNVRNWGTKWDIAVRDDEQYADTAMERNDDGSVHYRFNTAWSPVFEVVHALSKMYPSLEFGYSYEEEQGWGGEAEFAGGEMISSSEYDIPDSHADHISRDCCECNCEVEPDYPEYWYKDCPKALERTDLYWDEDNHGWYEKDLDNAPSV
jgi:hypothetical protein